MEEFGGQRGVTIGRSLRRRKERRKLEDQEFKVIPGLNPLLQKIKKAKGHRLYSSAVRNRIQRSGR